MKKIILPIVIAILALIIMFMGIRSFFIYKQAVPVSINESKANFLKYKQTENNILRQYGCALNEDENNSDEKNIYYSYSCSLNENINIDIRFSNEKSVGNFEKFDIMFCYGNVNIYKLHNSESFNNFLQLDLFQKVVNAVSGTQLSSQFIKDFMGSFPHSGSIDAGSFVIKTDTLKYSIFSAYSLEFRQASGDYGGILEFKGLTKASTR